MRNSSTQTFPLISLIVPIYNEEKHLLQCLDSLVKLPSATLEILLIDDGSTDRSLEIGKHYARNHPNITVFEQDKLGVSAARNRGIQESKGQYLCFVDGDDWVEESFAGTLLNTLEAHAPDLVVFGFHKVDEKGKILETILPMGSVEIDMKTHPDEWYRCIGMGMGPFVWNKVFKKSILDEEQITFPQMSNSEDFVFAWDVVSKSQRILFLDQALYNYRIAYRPKRAHNHELVKNYRIAMEKLLLMATHVDIAERPYQKLYTAQCAWLWFGFVIPSHTASLAHLSLREKLRLIQEVYQWAWYKEMHAKVQYQDLNWAKKCLWWVFSLRTPLLTYGMGLLLHLLIRKQTFR